jgi:hypothetical protein
MPDWMKPGAAQIVTTHPVWVDMIPWYVVNLWPSYHYLRSPGQRRVIDCVGTHVIMTNTKNSKTQLMKQCQSIGLTNQRIL